MVTHHNTEGPYETHHRVATIFQRTKVATMQAAIHIKSHSSLYMLDVFIGNRARQ